MTEAQVIVSTIDQKEALSALLVFLQAKDTKSTASPLQANTCDEQVFLYAATMHLETESHQKSTLHRVPTLGSHWMASCPFQSTFLSHKRVSLSLRSLHANLVASIS